jgi:uncharacterized protein with LGFP repeats
VRKCATVQEEKDKLDKELAEVKSALRRAEDAAHDADKRRVAHAAAVAGKDEELRTLADAANPEVAEERQAALARLERELADAASELSAARGALAAAREAHEAKDEEAAKLQREVVRACPPSVACRAARSRVGTPEPQRLQQLAVVAASCWPGTALRDAAAAATRPSTVCNSGRVGAARGGGQGRARESGRRRRAAACAEG